MKKYIFLCLVYFVIQLVLVFVVYLFLQENKAKDDSSYILEDSGTWFP